LRTTDADADYVQYEIQICSTSNCSSVVRTVCQNASLPNSCSASQTGWQAQNAFSAAAYSAAALITNSQLALYFYQDPALSPSTQYWWRAYAIDPGGSNTVSSASAISTFTTGVDSVRIVGGTNIEGGTKIAN
jgi:hypothetical protein